MNISTKNKEKMKQTRKIMGPILSQAGKKLTIVMAGPKEAMLIIKEKTVVIPWMGQ
jgi:hypothetical protein